MDRYIGLDAHSQSCTLVVMGPSGKRLKEAVVETNGAVLQDFVRGVAGRKHLCLEDGTQTEWLHEILEPLVDEIVVVLPDEKRGKKNDSVDAWTRADELRQDRLPRTVFQAPGKFSALRDAVKAYQAIQRDMIRAKCRLNALYRSRGVSGMGDAIYDVEKRTAWIAELPPKRQQLATLLCNELDGLVASHETAEEWLHREAKRVPLVRLLATAPGIARIRAAQIVAIVVSPHRFRTKRQLWSCCGLAIVTRSSLDWVRDRNGKWERREVAQTRGLNRNRQPTLKCVFVGAADTIIRLMPRHPLHLAYQRTIEAGTKPNLARLTLARRIAATVLAMWKKNQEYDPMK